MILNVSNKQTFSQNSAYYNLTDLANPWSKSINQHHCLSAVFPNRGTHTPGGMRRPLGVLEKIFKMYKNCENYLKIFVTICQCN